MGLATTTLRIGLGGVIAGHGLQKLAGKFGGPGLDGAAVGFEHMGMSPGKPYATAAALTETIGGGLLATGLFTPLGASMLTGAMTVAIGKVHGKNGLWVTNGGMEYNLLLMGAAFAVTEQGPGFPALDGFITKSRKGFVWAVIELAAGVGGGLAVMKLADRTAKALPGVAEKVADVAASVSDKATEVAHAVSDTADSAASTVSDTANSAASAVSDAADRAASAASDAAESAAAPAPPADASDTEDKLTSAPTGNS
jgi:putative oxidoreductase